MMRMVMSPAALGLLRALAARADVPRDRLLLSAWNSVDWQSLTFVGERHEGQIRIVAPDSAAVAARIATGLEEAEFAIRGHVVADITTVGDARTESDGSTLLRIEALTIAE